MGQIISIKFSKKEGEKNEAAKNIVYTNEGLIVTLR